MSSVAVYDELLRRRRDLVDRLYEPFALDTRDEQGETKRPFLPIAPCRFANGRLRTFWHGDYFRSALRHPEVTRWTPEEEELVAAAPTRTGPSPPAAATCCGCGSPSVNLGPGLERRLF